MTERHQYLPNLGEIKRASYGARLGHKDQTTCAAARLGRDDLLMELLLDDLIGEFERYARVEIMISLSNAVVEVLPEPEIKWEVPFLAINKSAVTMARAIKE